MIYSTMPFRETVSLLRYMKIVTTLRGTTIRSYLHFRLILLTTNNTLSPNIWKCRQMNWSKSGRMVGFGPLLTRPRHPASPTTTPTLYHIHYHGLCNGGPALPLPHLPLPPTFPASSFSSSSPSSPESSSEGASAGAI